MCIEVVKDVNGEVIELWCIYDFEFKGGKMFDGCKIKGVIYWVLVEYGILFEVCLYEYLFGEVEFGKSGEV